jgi:hypothetical protein
MAPNRRWTSGKGSLVAFYRIDNLTLDGNGVMDGQGAIWWDCFNQNVGFSFSIYQLDLLPLIIIGQNLTSCFFSLWQRCDDRPIVSRRIIYPNFQFRNQSARHLKNSLLCSIVTTSCWHSRTVTILW